MNCRPKSIVIFKHGKFQIFTKRFYILHFLIRKHCEKCLLIRSFIVCSLPPPPSYLLHYLYELCWLFVKKRRSLSLHDPGTNRISPSQIFSLDFKFYQTKSHSLEWQYFSVFTLPHRSSLNEGHKILAPPPQKNAKDPKCLNLKGNPAYMILAQLHTFLSKFSKRFVAYLRIQGLSDRMSFLKLLVLWTESTIGAQICGKISIKGKHF